MAFIPMTVGGLRIGLYIQLECSWWNHPFAKNKFKITSQKEINTIRGIKKVKVFYDPDLSDPEEEPEEEPVVEISEAAKLAQYQEDRERAEEEIRKDQVQACGDHTAELQKAAYLYQQVLAQAKIAMKRMSDGHAAGIKSADQVVHSLIHCLNKPESSMALIDILTTSQSEDPYLTHSINVCIVSILVGKEYNLEGDELYALGMAGLLHDLGKHNFPPTMRAKWGGLTKGEHQEWLGHPDSGKKWVERFPVIPVETVCAISQHHERLDGSGFPLGLQGSEISFFAKILMVADEYDHLCHQNDSSKNLAPAEALSYLYDHYIVDKLMAVSDLIDTMMEKNDNGSGMKEMQSEGIETDEDSIQDKAELSEEIVVSMVRALGVYPPGSLVELTNGSMALVTGVNAEERTKPSVMICIPHISRTEARVIDLATTEELAIVHSIRPQHLPREIHEYFFSGRSA